MFGDRPGNQVGLQQRRLPQGEFVGGISAEPQLPQIATDYLGSEPKRATAVLREQIDRGGEIRHAAGALCALSRTDQDGGQGLLH